MMPKNLTKLTIFGLILHLIFLSLTTEDLLAQITVSWDAVSSEYIEGYRIYISQADQDDYSNPSGWTTTSTTFTIPNLNDYLSVNTLYYFVVRAYDTCGNESTNSDYMSYYHESSTGEPIDVDTSEDDDAMSDDSTGNDTTSDGSTNDDASAGEDSADSESAEDGSLEEEPTDNDTGNTDVVDDDISDTPLDNDEKNQSPPPIENSSSSSHTCFILLIFD